MPLGLVVIAVSGDISLLGFVIVIQAPFIDFYFFLKVRDTMLEA
jgi:hypothetical protein